MARAIVSAAGELDCDGSCIPADRRSAARLTDRRTVEMLRERGATPPPVAGG
ncbi:hypothetical protein ACFOZ7_06695 [Natribaculum luteum]|uniref:Uncharacterized protein n=1 Tax=Natribaculum luteum TaxID=1586232 RepID=A0ABD5NYA6_9EURY|nr:hypothetical protein [Natribaculum luteum]